MKNNKLPLFAHFNRKIEARFLSKMFEKNQSNGSEAFKMLIYCDYRYKSNWLNYSEKILENEKIGQIFLPPFIKTVNESIPMTQMYDLNYDILIVTIKPVELEATLNAFGLESDNEELFIYNELAFYHAKIESSKGEIYSIIITMLGEDTSVKAAQRTTEVLNYLNVNYCYLVGMAAGVKEKTQLGDVILGSSVWYYERAKLEDGKELPRPEVIQASDKSYLRHRFKSSRFSKLFEDALQLKDADEKIPTCISCNWIPTFDFGVIMSGEKLLADSEKIATLRGLHQETKAFEMEGYGFSEACSQKHIPFFVIRGISDFGDSDTRGKQQELSDEKDIWQFTATLSAATVLREFITYTHRKVDVTF